MAESNSEDYVPSTITVSIPEFNEKYVDKKTVTFYTTSITNHYSKKTWTLEKRYSEFEALYRELLKLYSGIPEIPGKTLFKVSSYEALTKRRLDLEHFLKECVNRKDILSSEPLKVFLELEKNSPEITSNAPSVEGKLENIPLGVRDFFYSREEGMVFMVCSDMSIYSRADSMITNLKFPWEKSTDSHVPIGAAFCYKVQKLGIGYEFVRAWARSFPVQTGILHWDSQSMTFSVGLDDGTIYVFKHDAQSDYINFEQMCELKAHKARVMGIAFDYELGHIFSCSTDKKFICNDINYTSNENVIARSSAGYTNLIYDKDNLRMFLTNEKGEVDVFTTNVHPPAQLLNLQTSSIASIRGLDIASKKFMMFTCNVAGQISVFDLGLPGKEKMIKEISSFGSKVKLRVIRYDSELNELISGDEDGRITVWSLKTGKAIYAWLAHPKSAITQIYFEESQRLLWTGGKDRTLKVWQLPEKWGNKEIEEFEENEIKNINDALALKRIQKTIAKREEDESDSDADDLNGWDYREY